MADVRSFPVLAQLVLVGEGPEESKIRQLVQQYKLECQVRFLGLRTDIPRLLSAADLFLLDPITPAEGKNQDPPPHQHHSLLCLSR